MLSSDTCHDLIETSKNQQAEPELEILSGQSQAAPLSGKQRRALLKKDRRKRKRQALAKLRSLVDQSEKKQDHDDDGHDGEDKEDEKERQRLHQEWLERERISQEEFSQKKVKEEAAQRKKEEEERRIREEWEEQQRKEREEQEQKQQEKRERETKERVTGLQVSSSTEENEAVQKMLDQAESQLENGGSWKNPDAPVDYGTEKDKANCPFFLKTGACRFGDRCSRKHDHPLSSSTLMIRGMFVTFGMEQSRRDDYDTDASLEYSEEEIYQQFVDFYEDVLPEFRNAGKIVQFKVSCNFEPHLRGNVYVQYDTEDQCKEAFIMFNGRWYAGKQLQCEFSPVTRWKTAICGLFDRQKCPKGKHCNFLHVFRNPGNEFWEADRDLHLSPDRGGGFTGRYSERRDRVFSQRSYSPERSRYRQSDRSHSREKYNHRRRRSNSRERQSRSRESWRSQHTLRRGRQESFSERFKRSRSREKRKSLSTDKDGGHLSLTDSRKGTSRRSESKSPGEESKNGSVRRKRRKSGSKSPNSCNATSPDAISSSHHSKRSKKSKKKKRSKKKQKRKRSRSYSGSSSVGSGKESGDDVRPVKDQDKHCTEMLREDVPLTVLQENAQSNPCHLEDESLLTPAVASASTDTETNL